MKLSWIEDFLVLVESGSFSSAASLRNISQPAFSRRIRKLEDWLGVELVDRNSYRVQRTAVATRFESDLRRLADSVNELRNQMRTEALFRQRIALTTQHTLMVTHLPAVLRFLRTREQGMEFWVRAGDRGECVARFAQGRSDVLICFEDPAAPVFQDAPAIERLVLAPEHLVPVIAADADSMKADLSNGNPPES